MASNPKNNAGAQSTMIEDAATGVVAFLKTIRKHWALVVASVVVALAGGVVYTKSQTPIFQAVAMVEFDPNAIRPLGDKQDPMAGFMSYWDNKEYYETQYKIITSNSVLTRVVRDLNLYNEGGGNVAKPSERLTEDLIGGLRGQIIVEPIKNSRLILIKVNDTN